MRLLIAVIAVCAAAAPLPGQPSTVILVRHAERAPTPPNDPVLTEAGAARAAALKDALAGAGVSAIIATQFQRTQLTGKPLADSLGLGLTLVRASSSIQSHLDSVAAAVRRQPAGSVVLVVGHSNTLSGIIAALGGPKMPDLCDNQYASLFVLNMRDDGAPRLIRATYGAADPPGSDGCSRTMRE